MPVRKTPAADLKRRYPLYAEAGLALALGATILAFTVPSPSPRAAVYQAPSEDPTVLINVIPTVQFIPPPPPPPQPPPPVEVADHVDVADVLDEVVLNLDDVAIPPATPPQTTPVAPPVPPPAVAPPDPPQPPPAPEIAPETVFEFVEQPPVLIGGPASIRPEYPEMARRMGIEGRVVVQFVVDERGHVTDPVVVRSPHDLLSRAAVDAVQRVRFEPGQQRGRLVKVRFTLPVTFRLQ